MKKSLLCLFGVLFIFTNNSAIFAENKSVEDTSNDFFSTVELIKGTKKYNLNNKVKYLEDKNGKISFDDIKSGKYDSKFIQNKADKINFGFTKSAYWLKFKISNHDSETVKWIIEIGYPHHDNIVLYYPDEKGEYKTKTGTDRRPFRKREILYRNFLFNVNIPQNSKMTFFLRIETESSFQVPLVLWEPGKLIESINIEQFALGLYYGIMLVMILYNLFIFVRIREKTYIYYVFSIMTYMISQLALNGLAFEHLWPNLPQWSNKSTLFLILVGLAFMIVFCKVFLHTKERMPIANVVLIIFIILPTTAAFASFVLPYAKGVKIVALFSLLVPLTALIVGIIAKIRNMPAAGLFLTAWLMVLVGTITLALRNFGLIPNMILTEFAPNIGSASEVILLSLALADRIGTMQKEKYIAQRKAMDAQNELVEQLKENERIKDEMNKNLEQKVVERTEELAAANEEMQAINENLLETKDELEASNSELVAINEQLTDTRNALWGEMEVAKKIQTVLLPDDPKISGYEISAYMKPADEVGGDYYDIVNVGGYDWIIIGDVSGHGLPAGLIMMMAQTAINSAIEFNPTLKPSNLLSVINRTIRKNILKLGENKYMTITVFAVLDEGKLHFAGLHQDILIYRKEKNSVDVVPTEGMWIGMVDEIEDVLQDNKLSMQSGDMMLLYTDGITESLTSVKGKGESNEEMYGDEKLMEVLQQYGEKSSEEVKNGILKSMEQYVSNDDITMVIVKKI